MSNQISRTIVICSGSEGCRVYFTRWGYKPFDSNPMRSKCYEIKSPIVHDCVMRLISRNMPSSMNVSVLNTLSTAAFHYNAFYLDTTKRAERKKARLAFTEGMVIHA